MKRKILKKYLLPLFGSKEKMGTALCNKWNELLKKQNKVVKKKTEVSLYETIYKLVYEYSTKYKEGFIQSEIDEILKKFPDINLDKFHNALLGITCMTINNETIIYHVDIKHALLCGLENRDLNSFEFD